MPIKTPHTKAERQAVVKTEMKKFGQGQLHSGSKTGPVVTNPKQAVAIGLSEAGLSKYDRGAHYKGNPGFPSDPDAKSPPAAYREHEAREARQMGAGYEAHEAAERRVGPPYSLLGAQAQGFRAHGGGGTKAGPLRMSGHSGAHRIGQRSK